MANNYNNPVRGSLMRQKLQNSKGYTRVTRISASIGAIYFQEEVCCHNLGTSIPTLLDYIFFCTQNTDTKSISLPSSLTRVGKKSRKRE